MKGICFKEYLFNATVKKTKIQTRRIIPNIDSLRKSVFVKSGYETLHGIEVKPRYNVGEVIFLKEPYYTIDSGQIQYKYEPSFFLDGCVEAKWTWKNKLFMPASKARFFIKITGVRAERLQDITDEDCIKEGIVKLNDKNRGSSYGVLISGDEALWLGFTPREAYKALINKINGKDTWESNPYVWVYDYELTDKPTTL